MSAILDVIFSLDDREQADGTEATGKVIGRESIKSLGSCTQTEPFTAHVK